MASIMGKDAWWSVPAAVVVGIPMYSNAAGIIPIVHALLGIAATEGLLGHPVIGGSWEGFCIETLLAAAPVGTEPFFYRTSAGAELDLVLRLPNGDIWAIEIKRTTAPKVSRGFHAGAEDIGATRKLLVYAGAQEVPVATDIRALPLARAIEMLGEA